MSEEKSRPEGRPRERVSAKEPSQVAPIAKKHGVSKKLVRKAIEKIGAPREAVEVEVERRKAKKRKKKAKKRAKGKKTPKKP